MPKSKRDKKVSLTKTTKKTRSSKEDLVTKIRRSVEDNSGVYVFSLDSFRNGKLYDVRRAWRDSSIHFGKNKIMAIALGRNQAEEIADNVHKVAGCLEGQCGLLLTNRNKEDVLRWFSNFEAKDYAQAGSAAEETVVLEEGVLPDLHGTLEHQLRRLGLPTSLKNGQIYLTRQHTVCEKGKAVTPEESKILKLLQIQTAHVRVHLKCAWNKDGSFENFSSDYVPQGTDDMDDA